MTNSESSTVVDAAEQSQNPTGALAATGRQSDNSTFSSHSFIAFQNYLFDNKRYEELSEHVASLQETNIQQENTIQQLLHHITNIESKLQSQNESTKVKLNERTHKPNNDPPAQSGDSKDSLYQLQKKNDDLAEKINLLTHENGQLLYKCQQLEKDKSQCKKLIESVKDLRAENDLRALVSGTREELVDFAHFHVDCMKEYKTQLASLKDEINRAEVAKEEVDRKWPNENEESYQLCEILQQEIDILLELVKDLRAENNNLRALVRGMREELVDFARVHVDCMKGYKTQLASLKDEINRAEVAKEELDRKWSIENEEAYQLCEILQQEIDMLRNALEESREGGESGSEENGSKREREKKLANRSPRTVSWAEDNCPRIQQQVLSVLCAGKNEDNDDEKRDSIIDHFENQQLRSNCLQQEEMESHHEEHFVCEDNDYDEGDAMLGCF